MQVRERERLNVNPDDDDFEALQKPAEKEGVCG
jgi:hypothetical protein